jgi:broad specificity phosphatase PhoE
MQHRRRKLNGLRRVGMNGVSWLHLGWLYMLIVWHFWVWRVHILLHASYYKESMQSRMKQTLLIIRHGQTTWNVEHRLPGQLPGVALTEEGRKQAERLAEALKILPISAVVSSPLERARETAQSLIHERNLEIKFEPDLMDTNVGHWSGQVIEDLTKNDPAWKAYVKDPTVAPEGVETFPQVQQRVVAAVDRWLTQEELGAYPAFVAHADVVKLLLAHYMHLDAGRAGSLLIDNASVSIVEIDKEEHSRVVAIGWSPRPGWLKPPISVEENKTSLVQETSEQKM